MIKVTNITDKGYESVEEFIEVKGDYHEDTKKGIKNNPESKYDKLFHDELGNKYDVLIENRLGSFFAKDEGNHAAVRFLWKPSMFVEGVVSNQPSVSYSNLGGGEKVEYKGWNTVRRFVSSTVNSTISKDKIYVESYTIINNNPPNGVPMEITIQRVDNIMTN